MGVKRVIDTSFWTDGKVDEFTPEDKYFMLYLLSNPFSTQLGIYEISIKQAAFQMGYSEDAFKALLERFENKYGIIIYSKETDLSGEIAIKNFLRHSIIKGGKPVEDCLKKEMLKVKNKSLLAAVFKHLSQYDNLNDTIKKVISKYLNENDIQNENENDNDNDNDNDNERIVDESSHVSSPEQIKDLFNSLCPSLPSVKIISAKTKKDLADLLTRYTLDDFKQLFTKAEASAFLKGANERKWQATFDWLIREENMAKVLNGNFDNKKTARDFELETWERWQMEKLRNPPKTAADDEGIRERAEALREQFKKE